MGQASGLRDAPPRRRPDPTTRRKGRVWRAQGAALRGRCPYQRSEYRYPVGSFPGMECL